MSDERTRAIEALLDQAAAAHHVFERDTLHGVLDEQWPAWYGAWIAEHGLGSILGRPVSTAEAADLLTTAWADLQALDPKPTESWAAWTARRIAPGL